MICRYCGKENPEEATVCNYCGAPLPVDAGPTAYTEILPAPPKGVVEETPAIHTDGNLPPLPQPPEPQTRSGSSRVGTWLLAGCFLLICVSLACIAIFQALVRVKDVSAFISPSTVTPLWSPTPLFTLEPTMTVLPTVTTIPTHEPSPTQTSTPLPSSTFTPIAVYKTLGLLFFDDFSNANSGWDIHNDSTYVSEYFGGKYRLVVNTVNSDAWANPDQNVFSNVSIEVDATKNGGADDNDYGIICRYKDVDHFYYGLISSDGYFIIMKASSEGKKPIAGGDWANSRSAINRGFATNHIRFDCVDDKFTLFVNGSQLTQESDSDYASGNVGLIAGTYSMPGTDILFDNFSVIQP